MKNLFRNRTILGIACIVLSLIICFGLTPMYNGALTAKTDVVRVTKDITKGEMITKDMLQDIEVGEYNLPESVLRDQDNIIGQYATTDLHKGDYVLNTKISKNPLVNYAYLYDFNGENRAISVSIKSFASGLSGKLEPGDIVSILVSDYGESKETIDPIQLQYVEVIAVTASTGLDTEEYQAPSDKTEEDNKELPSTVTLMVTPEQAKLLAELEVKGKIHIVFVYRGSKENANKFLEEQKVVLLEIKKKEEEERLLKEEELKLLEESQGVSEGQSQGHVSDQTISNPDSSPENNELREEAEDDAKE